MTSSSTLFGRLVQIIGRPAVVVIGSQAILGTYSEEELPAEATMSAEVDILSMGDSAEIAQLADLIEGVAGEFSPFEELHGFSIDGVDLDTAVLPDGWRDRLVKVQNTNTAARQASLSSPGGVSTRRILAPPNCARIARRTSISRPRYWPGGWWTGR